LVQQEASAKRKREEYEKKVERKSLHASVCGVGRSSLIDSRKNGKKGEGGGRAAVMPS